MNLGTHTSSDEEDDDEHDPLDHGFDPIVPEIAGSGTTSEAVRQFYASGGVKKRQRNVYEDDDDDDINETVDETHSIKRMAEPIPDHSHDVLNDPNTAVRNSNEDDVLNDPNTGIRNSNEDDMGDDDDMDEYDVTRQLVSQYQNEHGTTKRTVIHEDDEDEHHEVVDHTQDAPFDDDDEDSHTVEEHTAIAHHDVDDGDTHTVTTHSSLDPLRGHDMPNPVGFTTAPVSDPLLRPLPLPRRPRGKRADVGKNTSESRNLLHGAWQLDESTKKKIEAGDIYVRTGKWTMEEKAILKSNIDKYCTDHDIEIEEIINSKAKKYMDGRTDRAKSAFWLAAAKDIARPLKHVYRHVIRQYEDGNTGDKYTEDLDIQLRTLYAQHGNKWTVIGGTMGRSPGSVRDRFRLLSKSCKSGRWQPDEEMLLKTTIHHLTGKSNAQDLTVNIPWKQVALKIPNRNEKQCRQKWYDHLNTKSTKNSDKFDSLHARMMVEYVKDNNFLHDQDIIWKPLEKGTGWSSRFLARKWKSYRVRFHEKLDGASDAQELAGHILINGHILNI